MQQVGRAYELSTCSLKKAPDLSQPILLRNRDFEGAYALGVAFAIAAFKKAYRLDPRRRLRPRRKPDPGLF